VNSRPETKVGCVIQRGKNVRKAAADGCACPCWGDVDELLNGWQIDSLLESRAIIEGWRVDYTLPQVAYC